jgi:threonine/homoserine/homoserine lactone efflux protein
VDSDGLARLAGHVLLGGGLAFAAAVQPGPLLAFLASRVLAHGWRRTLPACIAPLISDAPAAVVATLVVGRIPPLAQHVLRVAGGVLLVVLAARALRESRQPTSSLPASAPRTLFEAVGINLLNPNPYLAWALVLGPAVVAAWRASPAFALAFVSAFYATMILTLAALVFLLGATRWLAPARRRGLVAVSALVLAALGVLLLVAGIRELWH